MANVKQMEGESLGQWLGRVRGEQYREACEAKKKAEQEVLERETMRARAVIEGMASAIEHALAEEGTEKRVVIAVRGFVQREDLAPNNQVNSRAQLESLYERGKENDRSLPSSLTPDVFQEKSALRMIVAACWEVGLDCWLTRPGDKEEYGLAVSSNLSRIKRPKKPRTKKWVSNCPDTCRGLLMLENLTKHRKSDKIYTGYFNGRMRARRESLVKKLAFLMFCVLWASVAPAQSLGRLAPPVPAVHRPPTPAQALCDQMARYAAVYANANVPLGVRTPERSADFNARNPLQVVELRRWAEEDLLTNGGTQPAAHTQAQRMPIATIVARMREAWRVPADRQLRFNYSLAFERQPWCDATTVSGHEPPVAQAVTGSLRASFCFVSTGRLYRAPHECGFPIAIAGPPQPEVVNVVTGAPVDIRVNDAFGYGGLGVASVLSSYGR